MLKLTLLQAQPEERQSAVRRSITAAKGINEETINEALCFHWELQKGKLESVFKKDAWKQVSYT